MSSQNTEGILVLEEFVQAGVITLRGVAMKQRKLVFEPRRSGMSCWARSDRKTLCSQLGPAQGFLGARKASGFFALRKS